MPLAFYIVTKRFPKIAEFPKSEQIDQTRRTTRVEVKFTGISFSDKLSCKQEEKSSGSPQKLLYSSASIF